MTFSSRLMVGAVSIVVLTVSLLTLGTRGRLTRYVEDALINELEIEARLIAIAVDEEAADLNAAARGFGDLTGYRVTFISSDGTVLADSDFDRASLGLLENHFSRPEIVDALANTLGVAKRVSASTDRLELKVAIPSPQGFVRLSAPLEHTGPVVTGSQRAIVGLALLASAIGLILAIVGARGVAKPLVRLTEAVQLASGGEDPVYPESSIPEIRDLVWALRSLHEDQRTRLAQLRQERKETATLIDSMVEGVIAADARGRVVLCNNAMRRLLGFSHGQPIPTLSEMFYQPDTRAVVDEVTRRRPVLGREVELDGRTILMTARPLPNGGSVLGVLDVSDVRRLQVVRRDFVANVSHELKTPLTSILGYAETLLGDDTDHTMRKNFLSVIVSNARRMEYLVDDLLDLARVESGAWTPRRSVVDVSAVANEAWKLLAERRRGRKVGLNVTAAPDLTLVTDKQAFQQIATNLFDNAVRHTPDGGQITLNAFRRDHVVVVEVKDTGSGMNAEHVPRVFERFYRVDPGRSRQDGGTGLGLAIVKHLMETQGGRVELQSTLGVGTTVRLEFGISDEPVETMG